MHTTNSDGQQDVDTVVNYYKSIGADFIAITDHNYVTDTSSYRTSTFTTLIGYEDTQSDRHLLRLENNTFIVLCHPHWEGTPLTYSDVVSIVENESVDAIEIFNGDYAYDYWYNLLRDGYKVYAMASVDTHDINQDYADNAWIVVYAPVLDNSTILNSLLSGKYYCVIGNYSSGKYIMLDENGFKINNYEMGGTYVVNLGSTLTVYANFSSSEPITKIQLLKITSGGTIIEDEVMPNTNQYDYTYTITVDEDSVYLVYAETANAKLWTNPIWLQAIATPTPTPTPTGMFSTTLEQTSITVEPEEEFTIEATVTNNGDVQGTAEIRLKDHNGNIVDYQTIMLNAGQSVTIALSGTAPESEGTYTWTVETYNVDNETIDDTDTLTVEVEKEALFPWLPIELPSDMMTWIAILLAILVFLAFLKVLFDTVDDIIRDTKRFIRRK